MKPKLLFGICGSFCNHHNILSQCEKIKQDYDITFVLSESVSSVSTRFFNCNDFMDELKKYTGETLITTLAQAEKTGPENKFSIMVIAPITATQIAKLCYGIYDGPVNLCAKAMLRNGKNIVLGFSSNDAIGISGSNYLQLLSRKHMFTLPIGQDDTLHKPNSLVSDFTRLKETIDLAYHNRQIQPIFFERRDTGEI